MNRKSLVNELVKLDNAISSYPGKKEVQMTINSIDKDIGITHAHLLLISHV